MTQTSIHQIPKAVFVTGASSIIGKPVSRQLSSNGYQVTEISRGLSSESALSWDMVTSDGKELLVDKLSGLDGFSLIHCAPIWFLPKQIEWLISLGLRRVIVFSSSSIEGKHDSKSMHEQNVVNLLKTAENDVMKACEAADVSLTIFRPTMIYGYGQGQNLAFIAKVIKRFHCFPVASPADGLRQPVHADDLAAAVLLAIDNAETFAKNYTLSGAEALPYNEMVKRIFVAMNKKPRVIVVNGFIYRLALRLLKFMGKLFGKALPLDPEMANRMQQNLNFDHAQATNDFSYAPNVFLPNGEKDLIELPLQEGNQL